uniref:HECT-type E3 ubiquitin transferase n=1 Tax=Trieres chinensis TaxID=1514140 RepID=A0A7S1ZH03_TRICV
MCSFIDIDRTPTRCSEMVTRAINDESLMEPLTYTESLEYRGNYVARLIPLSEITSMKSRNLAEKKRWFRELCNMLTADVDNEGYLEITVRREHLLKDSIEAIVNMSPEDMHKVWRIYFTGEEHRTPCDLAQEWFMLVMKQLCEPRNGFWQRNHKKDDGCSHINPLSNICCQNDLDYFHFMGRMIGKSLFDGMKVPNSIAPYIYKFMSGCPIKFTDLWQILEEDNEVLGHLDRVDATGCCDLDMNMTELSPFEGIFHIDHIHNGRNIPVTRIGMSSYKQALAKHLLYDTVEPQLTELLRGAFEVIPRSIYSIFHYDELQRLCGCNDFSHED